MDSQEVLGQLGLTGHEPTIYLLLLKMGESTAVKLAKESGLHRRTVYDTAEALLRKGLVTLVLRKSIKHYAPCDPQTLRRMLDERQHLLEGILPDLSRAFHKKEKAVEVQIYEGVEGMKSIFTALLKSKKETVMIGAGLKAPKYFKYTFPRYLKELQRIKWRLIEPDVPWIRKEVESWDVPRNYRFLPENYLSPMSILATENLLVLLLMEPLPLIVKITGKAYAKSFKNYFEILWRAASS